MEHSTYEENKRKIPEEELKGHRGKWVAFSADGSRIVASCRTLECLDKRIREAGEDPKKVKLEHLVEVETFLGGAEFL